MTRLCFVALFVACSHSEGATPASPAAPAGPAVAAADPAPCADVAAQAVKLAPETGAMKSMIEQHCLADAWSVELRKCVLLATSPAELEPCQQRLSASQLEALQRDGSENRSPDAKPGVPVTPPGPKPAADVPPPASSMPK